MRKRKAPELTVERLLYSRQQTAQALGGISIRTVIRFEEEGRLGKVQFKNSRTAKVFNPAADVIALAEKGFAK
jgi:hypothetical protein